MENLIGNISPEKVFDYMVGRVKEVRSLGQEDYDLLRTKVYFEVCEEIFKARDLAEAQCSDLVFCLSAGMGIVPSVKDRLLVELVIMERFYNDRQSDSYKKERICRRFIDDFLSKQGSGFSYHGIGVGD